MDVNELNGELNIKLVNLKLKLCIKQNWMLPYGKNLQNDELNGI